MPDIPTDTAMAFNVAVRSDTSKAEGGDTTKVMKTQGTAGLFRPKQILLKENLRS